MLRNGVLGSYKLISDMIFVGLLPLDVFFGIIQKVLQKDFLT